MAVGIRSSQTMVLLSLDLLSKAQEQFVYQFRRPGVFPYHCHFHGGQDGKGMAGVITVVERTP